MTTDTKTTEAVLAHHMETIMKAVDDPSAMDEFMQDYSDDALFFAPDGVHEGHAAIRAFVEGMLPALKAMLPDFKVETVNIRRDVAHTVWSSGAAVPLGTDTFIVRGGKIVSQTFAFYMAG